MSAPGKSNEIIPLLQITEIIDSGGKLALLWVFLLWNPHGRRLTQG